MTATLSRNCPTFDSVDKALAYQQETGSGTAVDAVSKDFSGVENRIAAFYGEQPDFVVKTGEGRVAGSFKLQPEKPTRSGDLQEALYKNLLLNYPKEDFALQWSIFDKVYATQTKATAQPDYTVVRPPSVPYAPKEPGDTWKDADVENERLKSRAGNMPTLSEPKSLPDATHPEYSGCSYLREYMSGKRLGQVLQKAVRACKGVEFDAIAYRGMSGGLLGPMLATTLRKGIIMCRKTDENSHSSHRTEGRCDAVRYIIVDDFISTGETVDAIIDQVHDDLNERSVCVGVLEYDKLGYQDRRGYRSASKAMHGVLIPRLRPANASE